MKFSKSAISDNICRSIKVSSINEREFDETVINSLNWEEICMIRIGSSSASFNPTWCGLFLKSLVWGGGGQYPPPLHIFFNFCPYHVKLHRMPEKSYFYMISPKKKPQPPQFFLFLFFTQHGMFKLTYNYIFLSHQVLQFVQKWAETQLT